MPADPLGIDEREPVRELLGVVAHCVVCERWARYCACERGPAVLVESIVEPVAAEIERALQYGGEW